MKQLILVATLLMATGTAMAHGDSGDRRSRGGLVTSCSDPRTMRTFPNLNQAERYCGSLSNLEYVQVGATYDYGRDAYTCSCYNRGNGGN